MKIRSFLIKYGEIGIKGSNRHVFEEALVRQIRNALAPLEGGYKVLRRNGRIYAESTDPCGEEEAVDALKHVFGITRICPVVRVPDRGFEALEEDICAYLADTFESMDFTFKVESRRARKDFPVDSQTMNREIGAYVLSRFPGLSVDVHKPDVLLRVEVREDGINLYSREIEGPGGMPLGTAGKAMLLLSGGIDSPVAGYMVSKRGVFIDAVYFHAPPYTSDRAKEKVVKLARIISRYTGPVRLHVVRFTDIQLAIYEKCPHDELTVIMRRYMMRIAEAIALKEECLCLVTGESIGQVASQTMHAMVCTNEVCTLPVYRPLIAFDKQEIVNLSEKIGAYETSIEPYEDCCTIFVARHPVTKPKAEQIRRSEQCLEDVIGPLYEAALASDEVILCRAE
ncbi:MAG: tRNA 4-thiouridine(8) synthase ThiI [Lachnospiraceae bacterium]|nr:tRNA 4-thiouridine(8) synthase ThiI [Lachnospiraceae bacterium]MBP5254783.1 tRNA 4-thiouridine(8) synthase ThiI [Lachnospiraceae bacterium]